MARALTSPAAAAMRYRPVLTCDIPVRNYKESMRWYIEVLGLELDYEVPDIGWCELRTAIPGVSIGLSQKAQPSVGGGPVLVFSVEDIDAARAHLEATRARFDGPTHTIEGLVRLATFRDPDGHALMLAQSLAQQT